MKEFIVVGRPNCGKTMFTLNFASFLGCKAIDITFRAYDGILDCKHMKLEEAKKLLTGISFHKTKVLQSIILTIGIGKTSACFKLTDTCGLTETINSDETIRQGMAQTLSLLRYTDFIFHIVDLSVTPAESEIDYEIYHYGLSRQNYVMLANKYDFPSAKQNLSKVKELYPLVRVIPIVAISKDGFKEVKACVARNV